MSAPLELLRRLDLSRRLDLAFFRVTDLRSLSLFRASFCALLAATAARTISDADRLYAPGIYNPIPLFEVFHVPLVGMATFQGLGTALVVCLLLAAAGLLTRPALAASTAIYFFYFGTWLGFSKSSGTNYVFHSENLVFFVLLVLSASPGVGLWGLDGMRARGWRWMPEPEARRGAAWALPLVALLLGLVYFGSAWCKLTASPLWADGYTLQYYLSMKYLLVDTEVGFRIAQDWWLCLALGVATIALEAGFWTVVFNPRRAWIYALSGLSFHTGIFVTMQINFLTYHCYAYLVFLFWPTREAGDASPPAPGAAPVAIGVVSRAEKVFVYGLIAVFLACIFGRVESWPFSDFRVYERRKDPQSVRVYRIAGIESGGARAWVPRADLPRSPTVLNSELLQMFRKEDVDEAARYLARLASGISGASRSRFQSVAVVKRSLQVAPGGDLTPRDDVLVTAPLAPTGEGRR